MIVVTGGSGQLGSSFRSLLSEAEFPLRREMDLSSQESVRNYLSRAQPSLIINCGSYNNVDGAEEDSVLAQTVNGEAVGWLVEYAAGRNIPLVTFSTDYVFDGLGHRPYVESDQASPVNAYGASKLAGEIRALTYERSLVVRTSWVVSATGRNFVTTMLSLASRGKTLRVVDDQWGCPTIADDLARMTSAAIDLGVSGLLHLTNHGATTWYRLAKEAVALAGLDGSLISPCTTEEYPLPAPRPSYSVLGSERFDDLGLGPKPSWEDSLVGLVDQLQPGQE